MPSLKDLKNRIGSVKNPRKITKAMQMVAAAKLRRAQDAAEAARPYAERMNSVIAGLASSVGGSDGAPRLLAGTGKAVHGCLWSPSSPYTSCFARAIRLGANPRRAAISNAQLSPERSISSRYCGARVRGSKAIRALRTRSVFSA